MTSSPLDFRRGRLGAGRRVGVRNCGLSPLVFFATGLGIPHVNDLYLRSTKVKHDYTANPSSGLSWDTKLNLQTMTKTQIRAFKRHHTGVIIA